MMQSYILLLLVPLLFSCNHSPLVGENGANYVKSIEDDLHKKAQDTFANKNYKKSTSLYKELNDKQPDNIAYMLKYAESLRLSGDTKKAIQSYNHVLSKYPHILPAKEGKGLSYLQEGDLDQATKIFNELIQKDASKWRAINALGVINSLTGNRDEAMTYYEMAMQISNGKPAVLNNIALSIALEGDINSGITLLKEALNKLPPEDKNKEKLEHNLALIYGLAGRMDESETILKKYLPEAAIYNNLGFYAKLAHNNSLAKTYLSKSLTASPVYYDKAWENLQALENQADNSFDEINE